MKKTIFIFFIFWLFVMDFQTKAQMPITEKELIGNTFELAYEVNKNWQSYGTIKFKKHKIAELTLYAANKKGERVYLPGMAIWEMAGDKFTMMGMEEGFRILISENNTLSMVPNPTNVMLGFQISRSGKDFIVTSPYINWGKISDTEFETSIKNKTALKQIYKFRKI